MKKTIILLTAVCTACCPCRHAVTETKDSVRVERVEWTEYIHDTVWLSLPAESVTVLRPDSSFLETYFAVSRACITEDGLLFHTLFNKPSSVPVGYEKPIVHIDSTTERNVTHTNIISVPRPLNGWQRFQIGGFWALACGLVAFVAARIMRKRLTII